MLTRKCSYCKEIKNTNEFRTDNLNVSGLSATCHDCNKVIQKKWYANNSEKAKAKAKERYHANKELINAKRKEHRKLNPELYKKAAKEKYQNSDKIKYREAAWKKAGIKNMTVQKYNEMFLKQNQACSICKTHQSFFKRTLAVDHCHKTGNVRGLLCDNCNRALGYLKESKQIITNMLKYIENEIS